MSVLRLTLLVMDEDKIYLTNFPTCHTCLSAKSRFASCLGICYCVPQGTSQYTHKLVYLRLSSSHQTQLLCTVAQCIKHPGMRLHAATVFPASTMFALQDAARDGFLDETIFRRANISLAMLAGTNLFFLASTFIPNPIYPSSPLLPTAALVLGAININQLWVSGINFVKYSPEGFNTLKIFKVRAEGKNPPATLLHSCCALVMVCLLHCTGLHMSITDSQPACTAMCSDCTSTHGCIACNSQEPMPPHGEGP